MSNILYIRYIFGKPELYLVSIKYIRYILGEHVKLLVPNFLVIFCVLLWFKIYETNLQKKLINFCYIKKKNILSWGQIDFQVFGMSSFVALVAPGESPI